MCSVNAIQAHIDSTRPQFDPLKALPRDAPVAMIDLLDFREQAAYPAHQPKPEHGPDRTITR